MEKVKIERFVESWVEANCYVVTDEESGESAVIDPGGLDNALKDCLDKKNIKYILITHGHYDHHEACGDIRDIYGGKICVSEDDAVCLYDDVMSHAKKFNYTLPHPVHADILLHDGDELYLGKRKIDVIATPGHTLGSVTFRMGNILFTGDTLFYETIGHWLGPGPASKDDIFNSIHKLADLEGDYIVYPGHYGETTLSHERVYNRFLTGR